MEDPRWNLDELAERVDAALAVDYRGQPSGRVRAVPDRRAIRWYTTIGLIDRPVAYRGRTALYGPRHLLQLVAVKRLQAKGLPLVAIQQELAGATDTQLARVANVPAVTGPTAVPAPAAAPDRAGSRPTQATAGIEPAAEPPKAGGPGPVEAAGPGDGRWPAGGAAVPGGEGSGIDRGAATERTAARTATGVPRVARAAAARRAGFWRQQPAAALAALTEGTRAGDSTVSSGPDASAGPGDPAASVDPVPPNASADADRTGADGIATLQGIRLGEGATLLLEPGRELDAGDVHAILDAARPLLSALRQRGFAGTAGTPPPPPSPTSPPAPRGRKGADEPRREQS